MTYYDCLILLWKCIRTYSKKITAGILSGYKQPNHNVVIINFNNIIVNVTRVIVRQRRQLRYRLLSASADNTNSRYDERDLFNNAGQQLAECRNVYIVAISKQYLQICLYFAIGKKHKHSDLTASCFTIVLFCIFLVVPGCETMCTKPIRYALSSRCVNCDVI